MQMQEISKKMSKIRNTDTLRGLARDDCTPVCYVC